MGILDTAGQGRISTKGIFDKVLGKVLAQDVRAPTDYGPDFPEGLILTEVVNGVEQKATQIVLQGFFLPLIPFEFGGEQKIVKDYYPGNKEPVVQVLGARESDIPIKGRLKSTKLKNKDLRMAAQEYQMALDGMRERGNLVKLTLGEIRRYGFIEKGMFRLNRLTDIEYDLNFSVIGKTMPSNCKMVETPDDDLRRPNQALIDKAASDLAEYRNYPSTMPRSLKDFLNDQIGEVAEAINLVTDFVDSLIQQAADIESSAARAVGLIKNARTKIANYQLAIGQINYGINNLGASTAVAGLRSAVQYNNAAHILGTATGFLSFSVLLAQLQKQFEAIAKTLPIKRHLVQDGDSLQRLAVKYYGNQDLWEKIFTHNRLTSTALTSGTVLEIPRQ